MAGETPEVKRVLTGLVTPRRSVCAPTRGHILLYRRPREDRTMLIRLVSQVAAVACIVAMMMAAPTGVALAGILKSISRPPAAQPVRIFG